MPNRHILTTLNALLILICLGCLYYLATARYEQPAEIKSATKLVKQSSSGDEGDGDKPETTFRGTVETPMNPGRIQKPLFAALYTPTPTPTPRPTPPPPPPNLQEATATWSIVSINDEKTVDFMNAQTQETFTLTVGGPPKEAHDRQNQPLSVNLKAVDMNEFTATLVFADQQVVKKFN